MRVFSPSRELQTKGSCSFLGPGIKEKGEGRGLRMESAGRGLKSGKSVSNFSPSLWQKEVSAEELEEDFCSEPQLKRLRNEGLGM